MYTVLLSLAIGITPTGTTREGQEFLEYIEKRSEVDWNKFRVLSFRNLEGHDTESKKRAVRMAIASLNRTSESIDDIVTEINSEWWAINITKIDWDKNSWEEMSKSWVYYTQAPKYLRDRFKAKTGSEAPLMRSDVFVKDCWSAKWYAEFMKLPQSRNDLLKSLKTVKTDNFVVGIIDEGKTVTVHRGKVARFETEDGRAVWLRMNYQDIKAQNDSLKFPENFDCDYNEVAFELPSGLDAYASYDGRTGKLSHFSDTKISVDDTAHPKDGAGVQLGQSCFSCHRSGAKPLSHAMKIDTLQLTYLNRRAYDTDRLAAFAKKDSERWRKALLAINGLTPEENKRHLNVIIDGFNRKLSLKNMSKELDVSVDELVERMKFSEDRTLRKLSRQPDTQLTRDEFEEIYPVIMKLFTKDDEEFVSTH